MSKGITPVVATVLLVVITVGASTTAYTLFQDIQQENQKTAQESIDISNEVSNLNLESCYRTRTRSKLALRNTGSESINTSQVRLYQNGKPTNRAIEKTILDPQETTELSTNRFIQRTDRIKLTLGDSSNSYICSRLSDKECFRGMAYIERQGKSNFCIFKYEASRMDAENGSEGTSEQPVSQQGVTPWFNVDKSSAETACQRSGFQLATNSQWQAATEAEEGNVKPRGNNDPGTLKSSVEPSESCKQDFNNVAKDRCLTGTGPEAWETSKGVADLNGNLEEIVKTEKSDITATLPADSGNITDWNHQAQIPNQTNDGSVDDVFFGFDDYGTGGQVIFRGGDWAHGHNAGPWRFRFTGQNDNGPDIGFRCVYEKN